MERLSGSAKRQTCWPCRFRCRGAFRLLAGSWPNRAGGQWLSDLTKLVRSELVRSRRSARPALGIEASSSIASEGRTGAPAPRPGGRDGGVALLVHRRLRGQASGERVTDQRPAGIACRPSRFEVEEQPQSNTDVGKVTTYPKSLVSARDQFASKRGLPLYRRLLNDSRKRVMHGVCEEVCYRGLLRLTVRSKASSIIWVGHSGCRPMSPAEE
jgi:hypothetical protein